MVSQEKSPAGPIYRQAAAAAETRPTTGSFLTRQKISAAAAAHLAAMAMAGLGRSSLTGQCSGHTDIASCGGTSSTPTESLRLRGGRGSRRSRSGQGATDRNSRCDCFSLRCPLIGHLFGNSSATDFFSRVIRNALPDKLPSCKDEGVPPLWPGGSVPFVFSRSRWAFLSCAFFCPIR